jgi:hypothetical protein
LLDAAFLDFEPVKIALPYLGIPNKKGNVPGARLTDVHIDRRTDDGLTVKVLAPRVFTLRPQGDGAHVEMTGKLLTPVRISTLARAFYKIGLGILCLEDRDLAFSERYDGVRSVILAAEDAHGYLIIGKRFEIQNEVKAQHQIGIIEGQPATIFEMDIFGVPVFFEMERRLLDERLETAARQLGHNILTF